MKRTTKNEEVVLEEEKHEKDEEGKKAKKARRKVNRWILRMLHQSKRSLQGRKGPGAG